MNKTELITAIAEQAELSKKDAEKALKAFVDIVGEELKKKVRRFRWLVSEHLKSAKRPAREGRNPQTGESMTIEASKAPKFKAGKALKDLVNNK